MTNRVINIGPRRSLFITKKDIKREIQKRGNTDAIQRVSNLHKKYKLGRPTKLTRSVIKTRIKNSKTISREAKNKIKIFRVKGLRDRKGNQMFIPGLPKGVKLRNNSK